VLHLTPEESHIADGGKGEGAAMAMRILSQACSLIGATRLVPINSAHIDGCLYHGDSGTLFAEKLVALGANVAVPTTLNVGALDLLHRNRVKLQAGPKEMALRLMQAYVGLGCRQTWTCAPYQAGHRPSMGEDVAWGESNAVAFCNSVLGARTNRYGDFLDICAAITARAPFVGLHNPENRIATILIDVSGIDLRLVESDAFFPVLGAWLGRNVGSVGLFHVIGCTPEAPDRETAFAGRAPYRSIRVTGTDLAQERAALSTIQAKAGDRVDAVAIGSPHLSATEFLALETALRGRACAIPLYACTGRHVIAEKADAALRALERAGVVIVADTCIVVTPILPRQGGVLMTNSGKFAHYAPGTIGYDVVFGTLDECVETAVSGHLQFSLPA
jgi:predicted aconitase